MRKGHSSVGARCARVCEGEEEEEKEEETDAEAEEGWSETSLQDVSPDLCEPNCPTISFHKK